MGQPEWLRTTSVRERCALGNGRRRKHHREGRPAAPSQIDSRTEVLDDELTMEELARSRRCLVEHDQWSLHSAGTPPASAMRTTRSRASIVKVALEPPCMWSIHLAAEVPRAVSTATGRRGHALVTQPWSPSADPCTLI